MTVTKAIIPVAGWGTRRLPITKAIEKSMLPIGDIPVIDFVVQDCIKAGITDIYFVVGEQSSQIQTYYGRNEALEKYLVNNGKAALIEKVTPPQNVSFHFVTQPSDGRYGTTYPVWLCRDQIEDGEQVLVIMGDQFFHRTDGGSNAAELIQLVSETGLTTGLLGVPIPIEEVEKYGVIEKDDQDNYIRIVEHPKPEDAPSNLNNASFYLFDSKMFDYIDQDMARPHTGEYMIIDPINQYVKEGGRIIVGQAKGEYLDAGSKDGWLHANNVIASS